MASSSTSLSTAASASNKRVTTRCTGSLSIIEDFTENKESKENAFRLDLDLDLDERKEIYRNRGRGDGREGGRGRRLQRLGNG